MLGSNPSGVLLIVSAAAKRATPASGSPLQKLDRCQRRGRCADPRSVELGEPAGPLRVLARKLQVAAMSGDERHRDEDRRRLDFVARVLDAQAPRPLCTLARECVPAGAKLDQREVPECVRGHPFVALAPLHIQALEQRPALLEVDRPDQNVCQREARLDGRLGRVVRGSELVRPLGKLERTRLARVEANEREPGEGRRPEPVVRQLVRELDRGSCVLLGSGEPFGEADDQAQLLVDRPPQSRQCDRFAERVLEQRDHASRLLRLDLSHQDERLGSLGAWPPPARRDRSPAPVPARRRPRRDEPGLPRPFGDPRPPGSGRE